MNQSEPAAVAPPKARKFEAAPDAVAQKDFAKAVGAAHVEPSKPRQAVASTGSSTATEEELTTSRLLDAKRRARERMNESNE